MAAGTPHEGRPDCRMSIWRSTGWQSVAVVNTNDLSITGLNGDIDIEYEFWLEGTIGAGLTVMMRPNGDSGYNYADENTGYCSSGDPTFHKGDSTSRTSLPLVYTGWGEGGVVSTRCELYAKSGTRRRWSFRSDFTRNSGNDSQMVVGVCAWMNTADNLTSMTLTFSGSSTFTGTLRWRAR